MRYLRGGWSLLCALALVVNVSARVALLVLTGWERDWKGQA